MHLKRVSSHLATLNENYEIAGFNVCLFAFFFVPRILFDAGFVADVLN